MEANMTPQKITRSQTVHHGREGVDGYYYQLPDVAKGTTIAYAEFTSEHGERTLGDRERIYYILDGQGTFVVNGETFEVHKDDLIPVPPYATYNLFPDTGTTLKVVLYMEYLDFDNLPK